ncbi:MAG: glycosyltransferase family 4 protein [Hungatella sp.]|nr:glycosyltransferase family 4 protein [Hungatella sp.]
MDGTIFEEMNMPAGISMMGLINPKPHTTVMIYDVHASESGALAILDDLYDQICGYEDKTINWIFIVSTPEYEETDHIKVKRFPWIKRNWGYRCFFDIVTTRKLLKEFKPDKIFSLQNKGISFYNKEQLVYLHLPFILTDHKFDIRTDGKKLWLYQNVISKSIFRSLRNVNMTIVQTHWMKEALTEKAGVSAEKITILQPDITNNQILQYTDTDKNRKRFFYPATAFTYKNHMTILKALDYVQRSGFTDYEMIFTIREQENRYTKELYEFVLKHRLRVKFGGQISRDNVFKMYAQSILLFPSYVESFGLPLLEARLSGTYVLASDCPFSREILAGYNKADFFPEMDYKCLAEKIAALVGRKQDE